MVTLLKLDGRLQGGKVFQLWREENRTIILTWLKVICWPLTSGLGDRDGMGEMEGVIPMKKLIPIGEKKDKGRF